MKWYIKKYFKSRWIDYADYLWCEACWALSVDVHHIRWRIWDNAEEPENLIALCRDCHNWVHKHNTVSTKQELSRIVSSLLEHNLY